MTPVQETATSIFCRKRELETTLADCTDTGAVLSFNAHQSITMEAGKRHSCHITDQKQQ